MDSRSRPISPLPIGWAEHVIADGHSAVARCASTCATTTTGPRSGSSTSCLPHAENRVTLADETDPYGMPVARLLLTRAARTTKPTWTTPSTVLQGILEAAGAQDILTIQRYAHLIGGARMGTESGGQRRQRRSPRLGRPEPLYRDGSVCPTQGAANPALTIMALASRLAERLATGRSRAEVPASAA